MPNRPHTRIWALGQVRLWRTREISKVLARMAGLASPEPEGDGPLWNIIKPGARFVAQTGSAFWAQLSGFRSVSFPLFATGRITLDRCFGFEELFTPGSSAQIGASNLNRS